MEFVLSWVRSGLLFGVFASVILMLSPNKSYMKHIGMVVGLLFIMVMLHPLMELFQIDESTYAAYLRNYLMLETGEEHNSRENVELYMDTVRLQLKAALSEGGYPVKDIRMQSDDHGDIKRVTLVLFAGAGETEGLERYLRNLFGEDVRIGYEME